MDKTFVNLIVKQTLREDLLPNGDITTNSLVAHSNSSTAKIIVKSAGVIAGTELAKAIFKELDPKVQFQRFLKDGQKVKAGTCIGIIKGKTRGLLTGERSALNFLSYLSGIATNTAQFTAKIKPYKTTILDTRKTTPTLRILERYAVQVGGGHNHRFNLSDMAMIKDNHRIFAQKSKLSLSQAVDAVKKHSKKSVILEVDTLEELTEGLLTKADIILLDNMTVKQTRQAVLMRNRLNKRILLESSGGINLSNVHQYAAAGVDRISLGALTHSSKALDISLEFNHAP